MCRMVAGRDFMPTCADLASLQAPKTDGISFLPTLRGESKDQSAHEYLYWEFHDKGSKQAIRSGNWKGLRVGIEQDPTTPLELYNLEIDPQEKTNLASKHPEIATKLSGLLDSVRTAQEMNEYSGKSRGSKPRKKKKQK